MEHNPRDRHRRLWHVSGQVQGVGFRPFVYRLAQQHALTGFIRNDTLGVTIEVQGRASQLDLFAQALKTQCPPLALIKSIESRSCTPKDHEVGFVIQSSDEDDLLGVKVDVTVDSAACDDCLREMRETGDHRHGYGLINCTNCGPRYTIIRAIPYDRPNTTMAAFPMCPTCAAQYRDPIDRRFHAQPIACHECGPRVEIVDHAGREIAGGAFDSDAIREAARRLEAGQTIAIKGLGGFHLAVRADDANAVARLRYEKHRQHKPFALMVRSVEVARQLVELSPAAQRELTSPAAPIVLAKRRDCRSDVAYSSVAGNVAPGQHRLGVMLPYTPIHHLIFDATSLDMLVMTSGNVSDEPLVIDNDEALSRLGGLCDAILWHDRPIERAIDDSVFIDMGGDGNADEAPRPIRRARGYVPMRLPLPEHLAERASDGLCVGGELKNTLALVRDGGVILGQHLGDLTHPLAFEYFKRAVDDMQALFEVEPCWIARDAHPAYMSSQYARDLASTRELPIIEVQHHHAHAAALMAEHNRAEPMLAIVCDGVGYGEDGDVWGGELLLADYAHAKRLARLRPLRLPGGDAAAKDVRRCGLALLHQALGDNFADHPVAARLYPDTNERTMLATMMRRNVNCVGTTAAGRYFDGVAALLGVCEHNDFEAHAPMLLEALTREENVEHPRGIRLIFEPGGLITLDLSPVVIDLLDRLEQGAPVDTLATLWHDRFAFAWSQMADDAARQYGLPTVGLTGGVFCNEQLTNRITRLCDPLGLQVLRHHHVPPNDGGISFGQAAVAVARLAHPHRASRATSRKEAAPCV